MNMLSDFESFFLDVELNVSFIGYPNSLYDPASFLPILRSGTISTHPMVDYEGRPQFLIDAQVFPGSSGSPVFVRYGASLIDYQITKHIGEVDHVLDDKKPIPGMELLGVLSAAVMKNEKLVAVSSSNDEEQSMKESLGLGIVLKATEIRKLIDNSKKKMPISIKISPPDDEESRTALQAALISKMH